MIPTEANPHPNKKHQMHKDMYKMGPLNPVRSRVINTYIYICITPLIAL